MITVDQIKSRLQQLTLFRISLDSFEEWLTSASWNMHKDSEPDAVKMVGQVERLLAEQDAGFRSQEQLFQELRQLAGIFELSNAVIEVRVFTSAERPDPLTVPFRWSEVSDKPLGSGFSCTLLGPAAR